MANRKSTRQRQKHSPGGSELLMMELQQIHNAENQLARALPRFAKVVESNTLRKVMQERLEQSERLLEQVDTALEDLDGALPGRKGKGKKNVAAEGLIDDAREHAQRLQPGPALDAALTAGIQKTEHYCIASWGTAKSLAQAMGQKRTVRAMDRALKEGKALDQQLTKLAERELTPAILSEESDKPRGNGRRKRGRARSKRTRH